MDKKTTEQAASQLGISRQVLINYIGRHPLLRPAVQLHKAGLLMWTDEEIEAVRVARASYSSKGGRPKKQKA